MMKIVILAEQRSGILTLASRRVIGAALALQEKALQGQITLLLMVSEREQQSLKEQVQHLGITRLLFWEEGLNPFDVGAMASSLAGWLDDTDLLLAAHHSEHIALLGLLCVQLQRPVLADVTSLEQQADGQLVITRPLYDEAASASFTLPVGRYLLTLRSSHFPVGQPLSCATSSDGHPSCAPGHPSCDSAEGDGPEGHPSSPAGELSDMDKLVTERLALAASADRRWQSRELLAQSLPEQRLDEARVVVAGGRPFGKRLQPMLTPLAGAMGAAVGATRGAVDAGHAPIRCQIGQTGAHIAPEIYLAIGISGAPQHMAGIGRSRCIIAINKDGNAPLVQQADYWLQGDMLELVPALTQALAAQIVAAK